MAVSISISIVQNSVNVASQTYNITATVTAKWTYGSYNKLQKSGWLTIDGTKYTFTSSFNTSQTTSGTQKLFSKTVNVAALPNASKVLNCSASYTTGVSSGTVTASASKTLAAIASKSTLTVSNGTLGTAQTLKVNQKTTQTTHTIKYSCGTASGTICTNSSTTSFSFTPPLSLASQNTTGTTVSVTYNIITYYSGTTIGNNTYTVSCAIPASVKPSCTISVSDAMGYAETYGGYLQGLSKASVTVTPTLAYNSPIASYKTMVGAGNYVETHYTASFTSGTLSVSGLNYISATVTDKRGRSFNVTNSVNVIEYSQPKITSLTVGRCNSDGTPNEQGEYVAVTFSTTATSLGNKNKVWFSMRRKKTTEDDSKYQDVQLTGLTTTSYNVNGHRAIFAAEKTSSYDVILGVTDMFLTDVGRTTVSTAYTIMDWTETGHGMSIGKIAELEGVLDIGMQAKFTGGIMNEVLEKISDLNDVLTPNTYVSVNLGAQSYTNCPVASGTFVLEVVSAGAEGQTMQRLTTTYKEGRHEVYVRHYFQGTWGSWVCVHKDTGWVDLTLQSGISVGTEAGYLRGRLLNNVLYIRGDVTGIAANWKFFAQVPSSLIGGKLPSSTRFGGVYNMSYFCGMNLTSNGQLYVSANSYGSWDSTKLVSVNVAIAL